MRLGYTMVPIGTGWRRAIGQSPVLLGLGMIGLIWGSLSFHLSVERDAAEGAAIQNSSNLARALEQHLSRVVGEIDRSIKIMRKYYVLYPEGFEFRDWLHSS